VSQALYQLATSDRTASAVKQLIASGELIDRKDSSGRTALSMALENGDLTAARRLLTLHARVDAPVGPEDVPVALIPVLEQNLPAVRLLREFGANYSTLKYADTPLSSLPSSRRITSCCERWAAAGRLCRPSVSR
jgi:ankyrin repeat protein